MYVETQAGARTKTDQVVEAWKQTFGKSWLQIVLKALLFFSKLATS